MATQSELDKVYMTCAEAHGGISKVVRAKVGAAIVTPQGVVLPGVNGLPRPLGNVCETKEYTPTGVELKTKPEVIHAELACILKAAREGVSVEGSVLYE